jgi:hypothetical protein
MFTLPVLRAEFSAPKMGKFFKRAEIHAPLIPLPGSVRSFESPGSLVPHSAKSISCSYIQWRPVFQLWYPRLILLCCIEDVL